jgi:small-conductance mechanosensitive channel
MTKKFDRDTYFKTIEAFKEIKDHQKRQRQNDELNNQIPESTWVNAKSILLASLIIGLSLFVLVGSIMLVPFILAGILGYGIFLWAKSSIK